MNRNNKIINLYEKINNDEVLLQSLKAGDVYLCSKCQNFKNVNEFSKNTTWCKICKKTKVSIDLTTCECGDIMYVRSFNKHLSTRSHSRKMDNMRKENNSPE